MSAHTVAGAAMPVIFSAWERLRGLERFSLCDWSGQTTCVLFLGGCNLRCPTCHNAELAFAPERLPGLFTPDVRAFLARRAGWLDAVVVSGGEPTLAPGLGDMLAEIKAMGFGVKLDTNATNPALIRELLSEGVVDLVAVDVKGPWATYPALTGGSMGAEAAETLLNEHFTMAAGAPGRFHFRTTRVPSLSAEDLNAVRAQVPKKFSLTFQPYVEPRRSHAGADQETGRMPGNVVQRTHRPSHPEGAQGQWHQGPTPCPPLGGPGREEAR